MNRIVLVFSVSLVVSLSCNSQSLISGYISDNFQNSIPYARVVERDSLNNILSFRYSDDDGYYELTLKSQKTAFVEFSHLGFSTERLKVNLDSDSILLNVELKEELFILNEVIIEARKPITVKEDTTVFDAASFSDGNEEVVEDLLKKIPGLKIDENGKIMIGNTEVEKVMVEGDDFFGKGYRLITKNMPAQPIDQVELLHDYSSNPLLKGIEQSDKIALNLKLSEEAKSQWFSNINVGYGLDKRHTFTGNLFNFSKKNKYYVLSNLNNIGYESTGEVEHLVNPYNSDNLDVIGDNEGAPSLVDITTVVLDFKKSRTNFNNDRLFSVNAIFNPSNNLKVKTLGFLNTKDRTFFQNSIENFQAADTKFINQETNQWNNETFNRFVKADFEYTMKPNQILISSTSFNRSNEVTLNRLVFNGKSTNEDLSNVNTRFDQKFSLSTKLNPTNVLLVKARYVYESKPQEYEVNRFFFSDLFSEVDSANRIKQANESVLKYGGFEAHFLKRKLNNDLLEMKLGSQMQMNYLNTTFNILDHSKTIISEPSNYQNKTHYLTNDSYFTTKYLKKFKKISLIGILGLHHLHNQNENLGTKNSQNVFFVNPSFGFTWKPNNKHEVKSTYSFSTQNAGVLDVYDNWKLTGFRSFDRGTGSFNQLNSSTALLTYQYGGWSDNFLVNTVILYNKNHDFFSTNTILEQNYSQSKKIVFKKREFISISSDIDRYIPFLSSNLKLRVSYSKIGYQNIVNDILRTVNSRHFMSGFELRSAFTGLFNYHIGSDWNKSLIKTTTTNSFTNNMSFLDLLFKLNAKSTIQVQTERYLFGNTGLNNSYYFLDFDWRYTVKPNKLTLTLSGRNLLQTDSFLTASISDISALTTEYNLLPRYILIKAEYRF